MCILELCKVYSNLAIKNNVRSRHCLICLYVRHPAILTIPEPARGYSISIDCRLAADAVRSVLCMMYRMSQSGH